MAAEEMDLKTRKGAAALLLYGEAYPGWPRSCGKSETQDQCTISLMY